MKSHLSAIALILTMALTRFHHFGSAISVPDASLAVFFLAGWFRPNWQLFVGLLLEAALIDYAAISQGTSSYCVTPAYLFLIPTYAIMWFAGRHARRSLDSAGKALAVVAWSAASALLAYTVSSGSFFLLSDYFADLSWQDYLSRTSQYIAPYLTAAMMYIAGGLAIDRTLVKMGTMSRTAASRQ